MKFFNVHFKLALILFLSICMFCGGFAQCAMQTRIWASGEYLYWWTQNSPISVPLATQNSSSFAIIDQPGTEIIFGAGSHNNTFNFGGNSGARITIGGWIDDAYRYGIEGNAFGFYQAKKTLSASSQGRNNLIIDVPFYSVLSSNENVLVGNRPNTISDTDTFQSSSIELNGLYNVFNQAIFPLILSAGFRFMNINEKLSLNDAIYNTPNLPANFILNVQDQFSTQNNFYGIQIGSRTDFSCGQIFFEALAEVAAGINFQRLSISGQTNLNNIIIIQPVGLFSEPTNIGVFKHHQFAFMPELKMKAGYHVKIYLYIYNV